MSRALREHQGSFWSFECATCPFRDRCDLAFLGASGCACLCRGQAEVHTGDDCRHVCRERPTPYRSLEQHVAETLSLNELRIPPELPCLQRLSAWLPLRTHEAIRAIAGVDAAAVELEFLVRTISDPALMLQRALPEDTTLIAILNGEDGMLERLWSDGAGARGEMFRQLKNIGFVGCTGPTFSVWHDATERLPCHNEISLRRHHRILQEIADAGLVPIPNLYTTGRRSTQQIANWLNEHPQIEFVSRDFTMTRSAKAFAAELQGLRDLLSQVHRPRQVLLPGVSMKRAELVIRGLARLGHSVSLVTGDPILQAIRGKRLSVSSNGSVSWPKSAESRLELIERNVDSAHRYVADVRRRSERSGQYRRPPRGRTRAPRPTVGR